MACDQRKVLGYCNHYQCPYSDQTRLGYECVDIIEDFCECGDGCIPECEYSFDPAWQNEVTKQFNK